MKKKLTVLLALLVFCIPVTSIFADGAEANLQDNMWVTWIGALAALAFAFILAIGILKKDIGNDKMKVISKHIQDGAMAYLKQQYVIVGVFLGVLFVLFLILAGQGLMSKYVPYAFLTGGIFSGLAGFIGMFIATRSNARTAWAAKKSLNSGLRVAFNSGTVMGMVVVGLGLLDLSIWWTVLRALNEPVEAIPPIMITFGMGASSVALFARLGGGIFTKAADVGADLVGKVEAGIPEDDPRNPATIADNVGDNVGDVAGMGADLYESYVGSIIATMALGAVAFNINPANPTANAQAILNAIQVPVTVATIGVICSILGTFLVRAKEDATQKTLLGALRLGVYSSTIVIAVVSFFVITGTMGMKYVGIWWAMIIGLVAGNIIGYFTEYYTSDHYKPTKKLSAESKTGSATIIIGGLALGMNSTLIPVITVVIATLASYFLSSVDNGGQGLYGVGIAAVGMLSTLGITLATDAYGPVADNAGGIAEMAGLEPEVREKTDALDSLGNTTAATGKGFAIGSAALTALALLAEYGNKIKEFLVHSIDKIGIEAYDKFLAVYDGIIEITAKSAGHLTQADISLNINILDPRILVGVFLGAMLPYVFSSMSMSAVGRAAGDMVQEVRRQFKEKKGIMDGTEEPDYASCVAISTKGAQREMIMPSLLAIVSPVLVGMIFGPFTVIALLGSTLASGFVLAIMMANAGGAWDNAKKYIESGAHGGKGSDDHKAAVVGDTVGDPFKDTSGPSINILIKLMSMVSIVFAGVYIAVNNAILNLF